MTRRSLLIGLEFACSAVVCAGADRYVALGGAHVSPFTNWVQAATNIQVAVDIAVDGDTVLVSNGNYRTGGRVVGLLTNRVVVQKAITVRSVNGPSATGIEGAGPMGPSAVRCAYLGNGAVLQGFAFRRGHTAISGSVEDRWGGGLWLATGAQLLDSIVTDCRAQSSGGGVSGYGLLQNCAVVGNRAANEGSGVSYVTARHCTILDNEIENLMTPYGGGTSGGTFQNCVVYYNRRGAAEDNSYLGTYAYTCTRPAKGGVGNITNEPGVVSFSNPRLVDVSSCKDRGSIVYASSDEDFEGDDRILGNGPDMGWDEYHSASVTGVLGAGIHRAYDRVVAGTPIRISSDIIGKPSAYAWQVEGRSFSNMPVLYYVFTNEGPSDVVLQVWNSSFNLAVTSRFLVFSGYTNYADLTGSSLWPYTNRTQAATNIQDAISANIPGGVTLVAPGEYASGAGSSEGGMPCRLAITNRCTVRSEEGPVATRLMGIQPVGPEAMRVAYLTEGAVLDGFDLQEGATWGLESDSLIHQCGGGAWCESGAVLSNCWVRNNAALYDGGGVCGGVIHGGEVAGNVAGRDGGGGWGCRISGAVISSNEAGWYGGGISSGQVYRSVLHGNVAGVQGGAIQNSQVENSVLYNNQADYGGGMASSVGWHLTVSGNRALSKGGGLYRCQVTNAIVYFNESEAPWENYNNSICRSTCTSPDPQAEGSFEADPQFVNATNHDFRLVFSSPCVDAGISNATLVDITGTPRPLDGRGTGVARWDMGAYEFSRFRFVATNGGNRWPYSTWADAARTIQSAVDSAVEGDVIWVSNGVYSTGGRAWGGALSNRVVVDKVVTIQSVRGYSNTVIRGTGPLGPAAVRGVWLGAGAVLSGFTITNGHTLSGVGLEAERMGGGLYGEPGSIVSNCWVSGNRAVLGGGIARGAAYNCVVAGNQSELDGGGAWASHLEHCTVAANTAGGTGGGVYDSTVRNSIVYFNQAGNFSGGDWRYSCTTPEPVGGVGIMIDDPLLEDASGGRYRLQAASPCIDSAEPTSLAFDLVGVGRPLDGRNLGVSAWDMGAYEAVHPLVDSDGDGLLDGEEVDLFQTNPARADTDEDGQKDGEEIIAGTDPRSAASFFAVQFTRILDGAVLWGWPSVTGRLYTVMTSETVDGAWSNRPDGLEWMGTGQELVYTNRSGQPYGRILLIKP